MQTNSPAQWLRLVRLLVVGSWPLWMGQACSVDIDAYTPLQLMVQDSAGKPVPRFSISALGVGTTGKGLTGPIVADKLVMTTDPGGWAQGRLHWHDNIQRYFFSWTPNGSYPNYVFINPCNSPPTASCELNYERRLVGATTSLVIRVKLWPRSG